MGRFLLRRALRSGLTLFLFMTAMFFLAQVIMPGDFSSHLIPQVGRHRAEEVAVELGLRLPIWQRYLRWLGSVLSGDLGTPFAQPEYTVAQVVRVSLTTSFIAFVPGTLIAFGLGEWLGKVIAWRRRGPISSAATFATVILYASFPPLLAFLVMVLLERLRVSAAIPDNFWLYTQIKLGTTPEGVALYLTATFAVVTLAVTAAVVMMTQGQRRIPVQYAKRIIGRRMYGGHSTHLPLRINTAGVIPIIFAQSIMMFPSTLSTFFKAGFVSQVMTYLQPGTWLYSSAYSALIIFFAYFYTAIVFNPVDLADNMKKYGGFIPGIRPGAKTAEYVDRILTRITLPGAIFLAFIAILPWWLMNQAGIPFFFGGTTLLIIVGVALDTVQQIESHLLMRHYEGFLKRGRVKGRR